MELKPYKKLTGLDYELSKSVQYTEEFVQQFYGLTFLVGNLLSISVTTSPQAFNHGLQKQPTGWIIFDRDSNSNVWRTSWNDTTITLQGSAASNIKVWVF